jgi:hypothetical protein
MSDDKTTPRPWMADPDGDIRNIVHERGKFCDVVVLGVKPGDAALIVRAVNAHDGLVKALEDIVEGNVPRPVKWTYNDSGKPSKYDLCAHSVRMHDDCGNCTADFARAALSKAKGDA